MMESFLQSIHVYVLILFALLLGLMFYFHTCRYEWTEQERVRLERARLQLSIIIRLLDAPDVRHLLRNQPKSRRYLFLQYSKSLKGDVLGLLRSRDIGFLTIPFVAIFFLAYFLLRAKALLLCQPNDLRFLSGLELAIFRSLAK